MINPKLNINRIFREKVHKCINDTFVRRTQPFIRATLGKKEFSIINVYKTRKNPKKYFKVLT